MKKAFVTMLMLMLLVTVFTAIGSISVSAAPTYMETDEPNVVIRYGSSSEYGVKETLPYTGTVVQVIDSLRNEHGKLWYKLANNRGWVYSERVKKHSHNYSGNGGICSSRGCGYEWPYTIYSTSGTYVVTKSGGAMTRNRPYSNKNTTQEKGLCSYGAVISINAYTKNWEGSTWYRLTDGRWIWADNVAQRFTVSYNANGGSGAPGIQYALKGSKLTLSSSQPSRVGYVFKGWDTTPNALIVSYKPGNSYSFSKDTILYAQWDKCSHSYVGGICTKCKYEYPLSPETFNGVFVITKDGGAAVRNRPYSKNSTSTTLIKNTVLTVVKKVKNQEGNWWYQIADGRWIFSDNVTQRFTVSYDANGGKGAPGSQYVLKGEKLKLSNTKPTRVGYIFKEWDTDKNGSLLVSYKPGSNYTFSKNVVLYAQWDKCSHSYVGGICTKCNYEYVLSPETFNGVFVITKDGGAAVRNRPYSKNSTGTTLAKNTVLTVVKKVKNQEGNWWYQIADGRWIFSDNVTQRFTVSYDANGGKGAPGSQYVLKGEKLKLSNTKPTRVGYIFKEWDTNKSGSLLVSYKPGSNYTFSKNVVLYAQWDKCSHSYVGGICTKCNYEYALSPETFNGVFVITKDGGAAVRNRPYSKNSTGTTLAKNTVLTVVKKVKNQEGNWWYQITDGRWIFSDNVTQRFTVTYKANGGTGGPSNQHVLKGNKLTLSSKKPTRVGYVFKEWDTDKNGSLLVSYKPGKSYSITKDLILYAQWDKCSHDYVGGICTVCNYEYPLSPSTYNTHVVITKSGGAMVRNRPYEYNSKGNTVAKGTVLKVVKQVKNQEGNWWYQLDDGRWIWSENVAACYAVAFNANGGTGAPATKYVIVGKKLTLPSAKPSYVGYVFKGWAISSTATSASFQPGKTYNVKSNATLYAVWAVCAHSYSSTCDVSCNTCGYVRSIKHTYSNACDTTCNVCGARRTAAAHKYTNACDATCNVCGVTRTIKHTFTNACDSYCDICGAYSPAGSHKWENGNCSICGQTSKKPVISQQPAAAFAKVGTHARTKVIATGEGLTYQWYVKDVNASGYTKSIITTNTYSVEVTEANHNRKVYCVIRDVYGNSVTTDVAYIRMAATIKSQPKTSYAKKGYHVRTSVAAVGDGLKYAWYVKNAGATKYTKSIISTNTYSAEMTDLVHGRRVYCVVTDKYGNAVQSETVLLRMAATIVSEPETARYAKMGKKVTIKIGAEGDGLTYQWYYKNEGKTAYSKSSVKTATYAVEMSKSVKGRKVYCVVKDKYGKTVQSKTFILRESVSITKQSATTVTAKKGATVKASVKASGDGLKYTWYYKNAGSSKYSKSSVKTATYAVEMTSKVHGRKVYCVVKDKYGNTVKSKIMTLKKK